MNSSIAQQHGYQMSSTLLHAGSRDHQAGEKMTKSLMEKHASTLRSKVEDALKCYISEIEKIWTTKKIEELNKTIDDLRSSYHQLYGSHEQLKLSKKEADEAKSEAEKKAQVWIDLFRAEKAEVEKLRKEKNDLESELKSILEMKSQLEGELNDCKKKLECNKQLGKNGELKIIKSELNGEKWKEPPSKRKRQKTDHFTPDCITPGSSRTPGAPPPGQSFIVLD